MAGDQAIALVQTCQLPLTGRRDGVNGTLIGYATVADDEFTRSTLLNLSWNLNNMGYAYRRAPRPSRTVILLHRLIHEHYFGAIPAGKEIDHKDRDALNCLPSNLRAVDHSDNIANRSKFRGSTSKYLGVCRYNRSNKWLAKIMVRRQVIKIGVFDTEREAADAVNRAYQLHRPGVAIPNP